LEKFRWSSYPAYRQPKLRAQWLRVDRLLGEHGLNKDTAATRREFERRMKVARLKPAEQDFIRRGWKIGAEDFHDWLADKLARRGRKGERARERNETDAALAERIVLKALAEAKWQEVDLEFQPKGHLMKVKIARQLRTQTPMTRQWIAERLKMGSPYLEFAGAVSIVSSDPYLCGPKTSPGDSAAGRWVPLVENARAQGRFQRVVNRLAILQSFKGYFPLWRQK
jgi:hypothetical protein